MPRRIAAEMKCARCGRIWYADVPDLTKPEDIPCGALKLSLRRSDGHIHAIEFDVLCKVCEQAIATYADNIDRELKKISPDRKPRDKKEAPKAVPVQPAHTNGTPPTAHAALSGPVQASPSPARVVTPPLSTGPRPPATGLPSGKP